MSNTTNLTSGSSLGTLSHSGSMQSASIDSLVDGFKRRIQNISFRNTTELNSTIYMCRAASNEFNYSSNPTYLSSSEIRVKNGDNEAKPYAYATTVCLHADDGALLATAKLSEPIKKSKDTDFTLRVRLDY